MEWFEKASFYHIYPLGYCGCEPMNDFTSEPKSRILDIIENIPHIVECGFNAVYFGPVFESVEHGYDTVDYTKIDRRLGTNDDFRRVCDALHENGVKVVLDGVFNHVGREFGKFRDIREKRWDSSFKDWFHLREGNSVFNDGFYYEGWEGHYELVKLNLYNSDVKNYIKDCISGWVSEFDIDGLRLDVAYCLDLNFLKELHAHCKGLKSDFFLLGETLHGDYNKWMNPEMLDSVTNYECYKGLYSSFNELNMFEIAYSLNRQFGGENWCIYRGKHLYCFVDNHDVSRIATMLTNKKHLPLIYTLLFTMPGIPAVYYGSEYGIDGDKACGDADLRRKYCAGSDEALAMHISRLSKIHTESEPLCMGGYRQLQLANGQLSFIREYNGKSVVVMINADDASFTFNVNIGKTYIDLLTNTEYNLGGGVEVPPYTSMVLAEKDG